MAEELLLTKEAAIELDVTPDTVRHLRRIGTLRAVRVGHVFAFERRDVERLRRERERKQQRAAAVGGR